MKPTFRRYVSGATSRRPAARTAPPCRRIKPTGSGLSVAKHVERKCFEPSLPLAPAAHSGLRPWGPREI